MENLGSGDPQRIGAYRLLARLGAGGMGQVYLARSDRGRTVAVKLVREELAARDEFRARFRQEVQAARQVGGYWTAPVLDADTEAAVPWVATGYVAGPSLQQIVSHDHGALPERSVRILAAGLAHALGDIHAAGIVHRDLKPSNVLITIDGPRVIDFGIARALETVTDGGLTRTGALVGSPGFMAPEQVRGDRITPACDIFCLGSVLAYAATGRLPFGTANSGVHALMFRIAQEEPDLTGVPEGIADLVRLCLKKDPAARPTLTRVLDHTGAEDTVSGGRARDPWLPGALVAQLGRHAVRLLETEDPEGVGTGAGAASGSGSGSGSGVAGDAGSGRSWGPGGGPAGSAGAAGPAGAAGSAGSVGSAAPAGSVASAASAGSAGSAGSVGGAPSAGQGSGAGSAGQPPAGAQAPVEGQADGSRGTEQADAEGVPDGASDASPGAVAGHSPGPAPGHSPGASPAVPTGSAPVSPGPSAGHRAAASPGSSVGHPAAVPPGSSPEHPPPAPSGPSAGGPAATSPAAPTDPAPVPAGSSAGHPPAISPEHSPTGDESEPGPPVPGQPGSGVRMDHLPTIVAGQAGHTPPPGTPGHPSAAPPAHPAYGYPQQHPQPSAYAYPQQPGTGAPGATPPYQQYGQYDQQGQYGQYGQYGGLGQTPPYGPSPAAPTPPHGPADPQDPRKKSRSTVVLVVVALVVALAAGGSVYALLNGGDDDQAGGTPTSGPTATAPATPGRSTPEQQPSPTPSEPTPSGSPSDGAIPADYLGTWTATIENADGLHTRELTLRQGEVGDTVLSLVADGPTANGTYHCVFQADLTQAPGADGILGLGPSSVTSGEPRSSCAPGAPTSIMLLPDGTLQRTDSGTDKALTYTHK
ncbi:protein kinase [Streptomyces sp. NPDC050287]|uniref:serine/threonine-protein kinase n=1 Tax=Streptomyces sp. NPDC050287 TaxID=3365608 RepID=UPI00379918E2